MLSGLGQHGLLWQQATGIPLIAAKRADSSGRHRRRSIEAGFPIKCLILSVGRGLGHIMVVFSSSWVLLAYPLYFSLHTGLG